MSTRHVNAFPAQASAGVDSFGQPIETVRRCAGCNHPNDPRRKECERCQAPLPQTPGVHFLGIDLHPVAIPEADRSEDDPFFRTAAWRRRREDYRRWFENWGARA